MVNYQEHFDTLTTDEVFSGQLFTIFAMVLLPDATPPIGQIHPISKMAVTFEPMMGF